MAQSRRFDAVVDAVEELSAEDQELLVDLIHQRQSERRRAEIAADIAHAREEYQKGLASRGSVDDLLAQTGS